MAMARSAAMSERTVIRRFREMTGQAPADWLNGARAAQARELLEATGASVDDIAVASGFGNAATLRHHFAGVWASARRPIASGSDGARLKLRPCTFARSRHVPCIDPMLPRGWGGSGYRA
jgi:methylphosphotriester-DNA--protein-cysteine methyltransferase